MMIIVLLSATVYVHDDAKSGGAYKSWNGSGSLTNGLIAPYQAFWVKILLWCKYITIQLVKVIKQVVQERLYRDLDGQRMVVLLDITTSDIFQDKVVISFQNEGDEGLDEEMEVD